MENGANSVEIFRKNLEALAKTHPKLAEEVRGHVPSACYDLQRTDGEDPTLVFLCGNRSHPLHSRRNPRVEAQRQLSHLSFDTSSVIVFLGLGLGYAVESLWMNNPDSIAGLLLVERDLGIFHHFLHRRDWRGILANPLVRIAVTDSADEILPAAQSFLPQIMGCGLQFVDHRPSSQLYPKFYTNAVEHLRRFLQQATAEAEFLIRYGKLVQRNAILNLPAMVRSHGLGPLRDFYRGQPAVLVAAGPSLNLNIDALAQSEKNVLIFCVDTAYGLLLRHGIRPDFVAATDPTDLNAKHFESAPDDENVVLLFESDVCPAIPSNWKGRMIFLNSHKAAVNRWIEEIEGPFGSFEQGLSVAHTLFSAASWMGCDPLILIGHDFAYSPDGGTTHATGTALNRGIQKIADGAAQITIKPAGFHPQETREEIVWVLGVRGKQTPTSKTMKVFLDKLSADIRKSNRTVFDATEGGALIEGTIPSRLVQILATLQNPPKPADIVAFLDENRDPQEMNRLTAFEELIEELKHVHVEAQGGCEHAKLLRDHVLKEPSPEVRNTAEWREMDERFWKIYRNQKIQIALEQALFPSLFRFIQQPKKETTMERLEKYLHFFQSLIPLAEEFISLLNESKNKIVEGCSNSLP